MIGTSLKVSIDNAAMTRRLGRLHGGLLRRGFGHIKNGALERVGHKLTGVLGRLVGVIGLPVYTLGQWSVETGQWAEGLTEMSKATGMSVRDLILLEEKFRLAGVNTQESGAVISRFALNLKAAAEEGGPAAEALRKMGFDGQFIKGRTLVEAFSQIAQRIDQMARQGESVEGIMQDLFGAKLGYQQLKLFRDWEAVTRQAENNVGKFAVAIGGGQAERIAAWSKALGRVETIKRSLSIIVAQEIVKMTGGPGAPDEFFDSFDPEKMRPHIRALGDKLRNTMIYFREGGMSEMIGDLGESIGRGMINSMFGREEGTPTAQADNIIPILQERTNLLKNIRDERGAKRFG